MAKSPPAVAATLLIAVSLGACSRASSPPPAADAAVVPAVAAAPAPATADAPTAAEPAAPAPSTEPPPAAAPSAETAANPWTTPQSCTDKSADARARATCEAKEEFRAFVASHQSCSSAADCTIVTGSCPFGCFVPVTKASQAEAVAKLSSLGDRLDKAGHRCVYRCMSPPAEACVAGRCSSAPAPH